MCGCFHDFPFLFCDSDTQFAIQFEIYEQHCIFEAENLRALNEAVKKQDFKAYLGVREVMGRGGSAYLDLLHG